MYTPLAIANAIVQRRPGRGPMGIAKMVYLVQGWSLAVGTPIVGALPEVWRYGPIHPDVYDAYRGFGHVPPHAPQPIRGGTSVPTIPATDARALSILDQVLDRYADLDDRQLSSIAHAQGSPWNIVAQRNDFRVPKGTLVDETLIASHFRAMLDAATERRAA